MMSFCRVTGTKSKAGAPASVGYGVTFLLKKGTTTLPTLTSKLLRPLAILVKQDSHTSVVVDSIVIRSLHNTVLCIRDCVDWPPSSINQVPRN